MSRRSVCLGHCRGDGNSSSVTVALAVVVSVDLLVSFDYAPRLVSS